MDPVGPSIEAPLWQQYTGVTPQRLTEFCAKSGVSELSLFESVVREDFGADSDVVSVNRLENPYFRKAVLSERQIIQAA